VERSGRDLVQVATLTT